MFENQATQERVNFLNREARQALDTADYPAALRLSDQAYELAYAIEYEPGIAHALDVCGYVAHFRADYIQARKCGEEALALFEKLNDLAGQGSVLYLLGILHRELADLPTALDYHQQQLIIEQRTGNGVGQAKAYNGIAGVYYFKNDFLQALKYGEKALAIYRQLDDPMSQVITLSNMLELYESAGDVKRGLEMATETEVLFDMLGEQALPKDLTLFCSRAARLYILDGDYTRAESYVELGLLLSQSHGLVRQHAMLLDHLGLIACKRGQTAAALTYFEQAVELGEQYGFANWMHDTYLHLANLWEQMGNYERAFSWQKFYYEARLGVLDEEKDSRLRQLEVRFQVESARQEAQVYRQEAERIEAQREQERQAFERLTRVKDDLLTTTTHDMKNPLASIKITLGILRRILNNDSPTSGRHLENIDRQVERISNLIGKLLDFAKLETGHTLEPTPCSVLELIEWVREQYAVQAANQEIRMLEHPLDASLYILCDFERAQQVLDNLVSNAIKYTPRGGKVDITVSAEPDSGVRVSVADTGLGIPNDALPRIFEPFYRVQHSDHQAVAGSGLGLAIVRTIIEQYGGTLTVESTPGSGSIFSFTLPRA